MSILGATLDCNNAVSPALWYVVEKNMVSTSLVFMLVKFNLYTFHERPMFATSFWLAPGFKC